MKDKDEAEFGLLAIALGFLTREKLDKVLKIQEESEGRGRRLGEILLKRRALSREQVLLVLRAQGKRILVCTKCKKSYNVHRFTTAGTYPCRHCKTPLTPPLKPVSASVHDSIVYKTTLVDPKPRQSTRVSDDLVNLIPGYRLVKRLGQGGMGTVYKARATIFDRWAAVKLLAPFLAQDKEYIDRFFREARNLRKLNHRHIVRAYDVGVSGEYKYLVMEFVDGSNLDRLLKKKGRIPERPALQVTQQVAAALDYAWKKKIVHRDVKPLNIMLSRTKTVKLCDLGLSKDILTDISLTITGSVNCSPAYAAPEVIQGMSTIDCRSDVYSLGVTCFQAVTGRLPFKADSPGKFLLQHVTEPPPDPRKLAPTLSRDTGRLILRMLEKKGEDRPTPDEVVRVTRKLLRNGQKARPNRWRRAGPASP